MIWIIQSVICALLFVANFAWHTTHIWVAVALNILLALSCIGLVMTSCQRQIVNSSSSERSEVVRNTIIIILIALYLAASLAKLNGSSTALWRSIVDGEPPVVGIIAGKPQPIRSDEWLEQTPFTWSQAAQNPAFPVVNVNIGDGVMPLLSNQPARHWSMIFRPQMWGYFFLDLERAFAFHWNFKWFALLLAGFLFLRIVARGDNFLALSGALLILFSSYVQWFFSSPRCVPEMIAMVFFGLWALHTLLRTTSRWAIVGLSLILLIAIQQFAFFSYPRSQIPLTYLALALLAGGFVIHRNRSEDAWTPTHFRSACLVATLFIAMTLLWRWHGEISSTLKQIQKLIYPGQVISAGGMYPWYGLLAPFLEFSMTEQHFPKALWNVCEASGFLFFAPFLLVSVIRDTWQRRADPISVALVLFLGFAICFLVVGIPPWLARVTGWSYSSLRAILAVGVASIVGVIRHLALQPDRRSDRGKAFFSATTIALVFGLFACFYIANLRLGNFAKLSEIVASTLFFATVFFLLWQRIAVASCILLVVPSLYATGLVNPIGVGVPGITQSPTFQWLSKIHQADPAARWIVLGDPSNRTFCSLAQFVKATGATVIGGTRYMPDREVISVLDPENRYAEVYDRYARICFTASSETHAVFELFATNAYRIYIPFQPEIFERLGVKYIVLTDPTKGTSLSGFEPIAEQKGIVVLGRR